ncbi:MAG: APC family permease [Gammaproteobacteria bacterium]|nr:APC family permease [Gammaproteobacteria bacterium]
MQLKRSIGVVGLTFVAVSGVIGSGWLFAPLLTSQLAGPASVLAWLIGGVAVLMMALCFAEVSGTLPVAGGIARIPHFTHGDVTSMALGWTAWVGYNTQAPIETLAMLEYLAIDFPWLFAGSGKGAPLSPAGMLVTLALLALFVVVNALGARALARANGVITWFKLAIPVVLGLALISSRFEPGNFTSAGFAPDGLRGVFAAVSGGGIIFAFLGFRHAIDLAGEAKNPQTTVPIALVASLLICLLIYVLLQIAFIGALGPVHLENGWSQVSFAHGLGPLAGVALALGIAWLTTTLYVGAVIGPLGGALVATGSNARLGYALSQNKFFPPFFLALSGRGIPVRMLLLNFVVGALLVFLMPFDEVVSLNGAAITLSFCAGPIAVYALRRQLPAHPRRFRLPAVALIANTGFLVATLIVYWSGWHTTWRLGCTLLLGAAIFVVAKRLEGASSADLDLRGALWLVPYAIGLGLLSYLGDFSGGRGVIPFGWDIAAAAVLSVGVFHLASWCRLPAEQTTLYLGEYGDPSGPPPSDDAPL